MSSQEPRIRAHEPANDAGGILEDFPLHPGIRELPLIAHGSVAAGEARDETGPSAAPLSSRAAAAAADAAVVLLVTAAAILAARWATGRTPTPTGLAWTAAFLLFLSFFAIVPALVLFGRTVGMALADLTVRAESGAAGIDAADASRRWAGTLATGLFVGLPLIWTAADAQAPTPADRFSGRALTVD